MSSKERNSNHKKCNQMESVNHNGMTFPNEQALHEWRLIFEFDYFMEQAEQVNCDLYLKEQKLIAHKLRKQFFNLNQI